MATIYTSRLADGGNVPQTSPSPGNTIKAIVKVEVGTTSHVDDDTVVLAVIPKGHELVDYRLAVDGMGSTTGGAAGYFGLIPTSWNVTSTNGGMNVLTAFNSTTQQAGRVLQLDITGFMSLSGYDQGPEERLAFWINTVHATGASMSDWDVVGWVEYKPIMPEEAAKKVSGAT